MKRTAEPISAENAVPAEQGISTIIISVFR